MPGAPERWFVGITSFTLHNTPGGKYYANPVLSDVKTYPSPPARVVQWEFRLQSGLSMNVAEDLSTNPGSTILHKVLSLNFLKTLKIIAAFQDCFRNLL